MKRLEGKKIYIYGDERYARDFMYVFDDITIEGLIDDEKTDYAQAWDDIKNTLTKETFIIVCKYEAYSAINAIENIGFVKNDNFACADSFFYLLDFQILELSKNKNIYVWGTGDNAIEFLYSYLTVHPEVDICGFIDSNTEMQKKTFNGYKVYNPDMIIGNDEQAYFIIASKKYYKEIAKKLSVNGKMYETDYISYLCINSNASQMLRKTIYDVPKTTFLCPKVFKQGELKPEGKLLICGGMPYIYDKIVPLYYSEWNAVWKSNVMKVVRLSVVNGTYSFCRRESCCYIHDSSNREYNVDEILCISDKSTVEIQYQENRNKVDISFIGNRDYYNIHEEEFPDVFQCGWDETCNLKCPSCRERLYVAPKERYGELSSFTDEMRGIFINNAKRVKIAGLGEAFASKFYIDLLMDDELAGKVKSLGLISNGYLATKENIDKLLERWNEVNILISMDGASKETAEKLRSGLNFDVWKKNMEYIGKLKKEGKINLLAFNFVVQRDNYFEMPSFAKMCLDLGADMIKFSRIFNWGGCSEQEFNRKYDMFDVCGEPLQELNEVIENNSILKNDKVFLFKWIDW